MGKIIRATAGEGLIKMAVIEARDMVQAAREIHDCQPTACAALGRTLCAASLLGSVMKEENASVTLRINGGGPLGTIVAVSDSAGYVRGYVDNPHTELPLRSDGKLNVGAAVGRDGMLTVSRDLGGGEPYISSTELVSGEIAEDITAFLLESDQVASACALGVLVDTDTSVKSAGGFIVQLMPGAEEALINTLEENIFMMDQLTTILDEDGPEEIFAQVLKGLEYHIVGEENVGWRCSCTRERVEDAFISMSDDDLQAIIADGKTEEARCAFCGSVYTFTPDDLKSILKRKN